MKVDAILSLKDQCDKPIAALDEAIGDATAARGMVEHQRARLVETVVAARHEDATEDAGAALRADAAEADHARVVPALRHGGDQQRRREFTHACRQGERERR